MTEFANLHADELVLDDSLSLHEAGRVACGKMRLVLSTEAVERCRQGSQRLDRVIREGRHVYGITTGFGPLANRLVGVESGQMLQQNLVHHLASGVGPHLPYEQARAMVLARLMSILRGVSGASIEAIETLIALLNIPLAPAIPSKGTVGASGDLTPLAHMVLCLQGGGRLSGSGGATGAG